MLYQRHKIVLALYALLSERQLTLQQAAIHQLLFLYILYCEEEASYAFIPREGEWHSYQLARDYERLHELEWFQLSEGVYHFDGNMGEQALKLVDQSTLVKMGRLLDRFINLSMEERQATIEARSEAYRQLWYLDQGKEAPRKEGSLLSIGYESYSIDHYIDELLRHGVTILFDVRNNPRSRKFGFAKSRLSAILAAHQIEYCHLPALGIEQSARQSVMDDKAYQALFDRFERESLPKATESLAVIVEALRNGARGAITCIEAAENTCHRSRINRHLAETYGIEILPI